MLYIRLGWCKKIKRVIFLLFLFFSMKNKKLLGNVGRSWRTITALIIPILTHDPGLLLFNVAHESLDSPCLKIWWQSIDGKNKQHTFILLYFISIFGVYLIAKIMGFFFSEICLANLAHYMLHVILCKTQNVFFILFWWYRNKLWIHPTVKTTVCHVMEMSLSSSIALTG